MPSYSWDSWWDGYLPPGEDYQRAKAWLTSENVKGRVEAKLAEKLAQGESSVDQMQLSDVLKFQSDRTRKEVDASFITSMVGEAQFTRLAMKAWLEHNEPGYNRVGSLLSVDAVPARTVVVLQRPGMDEQQLRIEGNEETIFKGYQEQIALRAKRQGDSNWSKFVPEEEQRGRVNRDNRALESLYSTNNQRVLKQLGYNIQDTASYGRQQTQHQEALEKYAIHQLDRRDYDTGNRSFYDSIEGRSVDWRTAAGHGKIGKGVLEQYGFTQRSIEDLFTINENGRVTGFTAEGQTITRR
jgi:hypothetical protein